MKVYLDDRRRPPNGWILVRWPAEAIALLQTGNVTDLSLDHDLGGDDMFETRTGYDVLVWIEKAVALHRFVPPRITIHSSNPAGRARMNLAVQSIMRLFENLHTSNHRPKGN
jgi:hypothetical protein